MRNITLLTIAIFLSFGNVLADNLTEGPWFNYTVNDINREAAHATSYSFSNVDDALKCDREQQGYSHLTEHGNSNLLKT